MKRLDYFVLILCIGLIIGYSYGIDIPSALETPLRQPPYSLSTFQFNLLYIMMYLPIMAFDIPLGNLIDRAPLRLMLFIMLSSLLVAQIIQGIMFQARPSGYFPVVLGARALFGLAGDGIYSVQGIILSKYCADNYEFLTSLAWGFGYSADAVNSVLTTMVYDSTSKVSVPFYISAGFCGFSLLAGIILILVLRREDKKLASKDAEGSESMISGDQQQEEERSLVGDIKTFTPTFWVIIVAILLTEASTATFIDNLNDLLVKRFGFSYVVSGRLCMIPYVSLTFLAIVAGKLIADNPQYRRLSYVASSVEFFFIMICLYFLPNSTHPSVLHYIVVITFNLSIGLAMGIFYSGLFTCIPFSVDDKVVGTAWGFSGMAIGLASCTVPLLYAGIVSLDEKNLPEGYLSLTLVGVIVSFLPVIHSLYMYFGPFGLLDIKYKDITRLKKEGMSLEQILREYSDREPTKNDIDKIG